jgi:hypothetical protein
MPVYPLDQERNSTAMPRARAASLQVNVARREARREGLRHMRDGYIRPALGREALFAGLQSRGEPGTPSLGRFSG